MEKLIKNTPPISSAHTQLSNITHRIALEVLSTPPTIRKLKHLRNSLQNTDSRVTEFVLITPDHPSKDDIERFRKVFADTSIPYRWIGLNELPEVFGVQSPGDMKSPETIAKIQQSALVKNLAGYARAPVGPSPKVPRELTTTEQSVASAYSNLTRQLSFGTVTDLMKQSGSLEDNLRFGQRIPNTTIVLSDLKNFSSLVTTSSSDVLNDNMARYYRRVREAVFANEGMLDKFIGDAVLAVFGYPSPSPSSALKALKFAQVLISIGHDILTDWQAELNAVIETGTRVGVANGDIWPLNIGQSEIEISLLGDTINLAARLEKACDVNGILLDNRTRTKAGAVDASYVQSLALTERQLDPCDAKGQQFVIRAWQVPSTQTVA